MHFCVLDGKKQLANLGKNVSSGVSCVRFKRVSDINLDVLRRLICKSLDIDLKNYFGKFSHQVTSVEAVK